MLTPRQQGTKVATKRRSAALWHWRNPSATNPLLTGFSLSGGYLRLIIVFQDGSYQLMEKNINSADIWHDIELEQL